MAEEPTAAVDTATPAASDPRRALGAFCLLIVLASVALAHELIFRQVELYLAESPDQQTGIRLSAMAAALAAGLMTGRAGGDARTRLGWWLFVAALLAAASGVLSFVAFGHGEWLRAISWAVPLAGGGTLGALAVTAWQALSSATSGLSIVSLFTPFRVLVAAGLGVTSAIAAAQIGLLRTGLAVSLAFAVAAAWCAPLFHYLYRLAVPGLAWPRRLGLAAFAVSLLGFGALEWRLPTRQLSQYANDIVYAVESDRGSYVFTAGQGTYELFVDGKLDVSGVDEKRYHEALVHPVMAAASRRTKVLLLGTGDGMAEREVLEYEDVESVTVVTTDGTLPHLAKSVSWLRHRSRRALESDRVTVVEAEPIAWLAETIGIFDVAIVDLPDPEGYAEGKNYTRHFYELLFERLSPGGIAVVQSVSPFATPETFATILATLRSAGLETLPYRGAIPTFGEWGFVIVSTGTIETPTRARGFFPGEAVGDLFAFPADTRGAAPETLAPSTLHDPHVVSIFERETARPR